MGYELRMSTRDDWTDIARLMVDAFHGDWDEAEADVEGGTFEPDRSVVATLDEVIVGHASSFTRDLSIPGGTLPAAHVTMVSVGATHRRQGLLTRMLGDLHADALRRNEAIAVLWASEGGIYQRYGYGLAASRAVLSGRSSEILWRDPIVADDGRLRTVPMADVVPVIRPLYDSECAKRVGWSTRKDATWAYRLFDGPSHRGGQTALHAVVHEDAAGQIDGYVVWRVKSDWSSSGANGTVHVLELVASNSSAYWVLWQFVLSMDLTRNFRSGFVAVDEPIQFMVTDPRRLQASMNDALWVRILDVPAALSARRYAAGIDVVLEISDARMPSNEGRWHLVGSGDHAICKPTDAPGDLKLDIRTLGAAYLGGTTLAALAAAGSVRELRPGTLYPASAGMTWHRAPSAPEIF